MIHLAPLWLEVGVIIMVTLIVAVPLEAGRRRLRADMAEALRADTLQDWCRSNWRQIYYREALAATVSAPLLEESMFRSLPVFLCQLQCWWAAFAVGLVLNVAFMLSHKHPRDSSRADRRNKNIGILMLGLMLLGAGMLTGLLVVPVLMHAIWNMCVGPARQYFRLIQTPPGFVPPGDFGLYHKGELYTVKL